MLRESLDYPRTGDDAVKTLLIGGLLTLASVLIVPTIVVVGYLLRVLRGADETDAPVFDDWETLLVDGLKGTAVTLAYFAVPILAGIAVAVGLLVTVSTFTVTSGTTAVPPRSAVAGGGLVILALSLVGLFALSWSVAASYLLPAALARLATTDEMSSALAVRDLWTTVATGSYTTAWLLALAVSVGAGFLMGIVSLVPVVGAVASAFVFFYANVVAFRLYSEGVTRATPVENGPETDPNEQVA